LSGKSKRLLAAVFLAASLIALAGSLTQLYLSYVRPKEEVTLYLGRMSNSNGWDSLKWSFQSPGQILVGDVVFGNLTLCCLNSLPTEVPVLYILTYEQFQKVQSENGPPTQFVASTGFFDVKNFTFSGPMKSDILSFRFLAPNTTTYYFWFYTRGTSAYTLDVYVRRLQETRSLDQIAAIASVISGLLTVLSAVFVKRS
jgi:hypothetical protein